MAVPSTDHIDMDTLSRHAAGQLSGPNARRVADHLLVCEDGRCPAFVTSQSGGMSYAASDGERTRLRTFQAREIMWSTFEAAAETEGRSVDELVCDAMATYAKARGYAAPSSEPTPRRGTDVAAAAPVSSSYGSYPGPGTAHPSPRISEMEYGPMAETHDAASALSALDRAYIPGRPEANDDDLARTENRQPFKRPPPMGAPPPSSDMGPDSRTTPRRPPPALPASSSSEIPTRRPPPPAPPAPLGASVARNERGELLGSMGPAPRTRSSTTAAMPAPPPREAPTRRLYLTYQGQPFTVDKDRYLLGRSKAQADLRIDDPNVSRQHAAIERIGMQWFLVDLGSTNGVYVGGERVARRALADGDVIMVISHQIRCAIR